MSEQAEAQRAIEIKPDVYPHDRVVLFSDAVFAIAITLLVIEIKIPAHDKVAALGVLGAMSELIPLFIGYVVSFLVISLFWTGHLQTWKYVTRIKSDLVWLNIFELLFVAMMPFTTGLYTEYFGSNRVFSLYCLNLTMIGLFAYAQRVLVIRREGLVEKIGAHEVAWLKARTLSALVVFLACILLTFVMPLFARFGFIFIFVLQALAKRYLNRRERLRLAAQSG